MRVAQAYFDVLAAQDTLAFARASKTAITEQLAAAKRNFEVGTATITDTREAQARFDLATAQEIAAENDLRTKRASRSTSWSAAPTSQPQAAGRAGRAAAARDRRRRGVGRPTPTRIRTVRRARLGLDIAQLETDKARAGHLPTVDASARSARPTAAAPIRTTGSRPAPPTARASACSSTCRCTRGGSIQNRVRETLAARREARATTSSRTPRRRAGDAAGVLRRAVGPGAGEGAAKRPRASSQLALEATQLGYRVGVRVNLDVLNAQTQLFQTRRDLARARYDVLLGSLRLRQAAGTLNPPDVGGVNSLLKPR